MDMKYTCIACRVAFIDATLQREHYKSDWHRYNLKRKVADFPPVSAEEFQRRLVAQREEEEQESKPTKSYCRTCKKSFSTINAYNNHLNSKRHKQSESETENVSSENVLSSSPPKTNGRANIPRNAEPMDEDIETDSEVEEVDSDEWDEDDDEKNVNPIKGNNCIFCSHHSGSMTKNLKHMTVAHSFFVPDIEYLVDLKGLLSYLGEKVSTYFMCLWCNEKGKSFHSMKAAQQHMLDMGHTKMLHEGEALAEYAPFYDYSSSYPDHTPGAIDPDEEVDVNVLDDSAYELVLPSGATIGHRSLMRYYRQSLDPNKAVTQRKKVHRVMAQYKALGWTATQKELVARKARDLHYMHRMKSKFYQQVGVKSNKLQKYFKDQSLMF